MKTSTQQWKYASGFVIRTNHGAHERRFDDIRLGEFLLAYGHACASTSDDGTVMGVI
jgi:hypothetical protein